MPSREAPPAAPSSRLEGLAAPALLLISLLAGMLLPVYTDEVAWRYHRRAAIDGWADIYLSDICGPNTIATPPWFMVPMRWFSAQANELMAAPVLIRLSGVACAVAWTALLLVLMRTVSARPRTRSLLASLAFSLLGLGLLPLLMVMSRPEQPLLLTTLGVLLLTFARFPATRQATWLRCAAILALATIAASYHLKGVLYAGIALVCLFVCASGRESRAPRFTAMGLLIAMNVVAAHYWIERFSCPGDPVLAAKFARENIAAFLTNGGGLYDLSVQLLKSLSPTNYILLAGPKDMPMSQWIPDGLFSPGAVGLGGLLLVILWSIALLLAVARAWRFAAQTGWAALREPRLVIAAAIFGAMLVWAESQLNRNVYEAAHVLPMLVVAMVLCLALPARESAAWDKVERSFAALVVPLAAVSQLAVLWSVAPALAAELRTPGYLPAQPYSVSLGNYGAVRQDIARAMAAARFPQGRRLRYLLVDDVTYIALQGSYRPFHRLGVLSDWNGSITDPLAYLRSRGSDGVVVGCAYLSPQLQRMAARSGPVCAIALR